ncbi:MAG: hypothetical protein K1X75_09175 [Leptospirales bacterium]|nr:hypothetical protein [Leptospirales bacterium]
MPYMAVGSRQILFSDSPAPAAPRDDAREINNLSDNTAAEARTPAAQPASTLPDEPGSRFEAQA